ncbi:hypothetical protein EYF80_002404 [Liparis tanakae]|uniref:Uncharacterized protein n=1 Tax=Liparis tanakae TaxID=230148 RepID=A0A4Z2JD36_9TELE|nr:hypothetical protein EYF80_002404 [Liparis tanakae]
MMRVVGRSDEMAGEKRKTGIGGQFDIKKGCITERRQQAVAYRQSERKLQSDSVFVIIKAPGNSKEWDAPDSK